MLQDKFSRSQRSGFRVNEFSLQDGHIHLIVETSDWKSLSNGVRALEIRITRRVNALLSRTGRAIGDRYHARLLESPREVRNGLVYVLQNALKHGRAHGELSVDPLSSAAWFGGDRSGWKNERTREAARNVICRAFERMGRKISEPPVEAPRTWLLKTGWRRHGLLDARERPAA